MGTTEQWRPSPRLPEYRVSNWGRVMRVPYQREMPHGGFRTYGGKPHYGQEDRKGKRMLFSFQDRSYKVHQLVCEAFHGPKPFPDAVVSHLDEDHTNNRPENLVWATQKENLNMPGFIAYCKGRTGENSPVVKGRKNSSVVNP